MPKPKLPPALREFYDAVRGYVEAKPPIELIVTGTGGERVISTRTLVAEIQEAFDVSP